MGPRTLGPPMLGQKHLYCGFRQTTPESTPVPRTSQGLCNFRVSVQPVKNIDPPWTSSTLVENQRYYIRDRGRQEFDFRLPRATSSEGRSVTDHGPLRTSVSGSTPPARQDRRQRALGTPKHDILGLGV